MILKFSCSSPDAANGIFGFHILRSSVHHDCPRSHLLERLRIFNTVKHLHLSKPIALRVAQVLGGLPVERATEVLPALENVFISGLKPFGPLKEAISEFASVRQLYGQPVSIHLEGEVHVEERGNGSGGQ